MYCIAVDATVALGYTLFNVVTFHRKVRLPFAPLSQALGFSVAPLSTLHFLCQAVLFRHGNFAEFTLQCLLKSLLERIKIVNFES